MMSSSSSLITLKSELAGKLTVTTRSYDGTEETTQKADIKVPAGQSVQSKFSVPVKLNGYHDIRATLELDGKSWTEKRSFVRLAPDTRTPTYTGKGGLFGYWSYAGGHHTHNAWHIGQLMAMAGSNSPKPSRLTAHGGVGVGVTDAE